MKRLKLILRHIDKQTYTNSKISATNDILIVKLHLFINKFTFNLLHCFVNKIRYKEYNNKLSFSQS